MICKICNQDIPDNKISLHYWNKHKVKYSSIVEKEKSDEKIEHSEVEEGSKIQSEEVCPKSNNKKSRREEGRESGNGERKEEIQARDASRIDRNWDNYQRVVNYTTDEIEGEVINEWL